MSHPVAKGTVDIVRDLQEFDDEVSILGSERGSSGHSLKEDLHQEAVSRFLGVASVRQTSSQRRTPEPEPCRVYRVEEARSQLRKILELRRFTEANAATLGSQMLAPWLHSI